MKAVKREAYNRTMLELKLLTAEQAEKKDTAL